MKSGDFARHLMRVHALVEIRQGYPKWGGKEWIKHKLKVSTEDIQIKRSVLRISNSKVFSSENIRLWFTILYLLIFIHHFVRMVYRLSRFIDKISKFWFSINPWSDQANFSSFITICTIVQGGLQLEWDFYNDQKYKSIEKNYVKVELVIQYFDERKLQGSKTVKKVCIHSVQSSLKSNHLWVTLYSVYKGV